MEKKIGMIVGVLCIVLSLCYLAVGNPIVFFHNQELKHSITSIKDDTKAVTLNEIIPFEWDVAYTFSPYTSQAEIEEVIGFRSNSIQETISEGMVQLLFVKDNTVVASVCGYPDNIGYEVHFSGSVTCEEKAVFSVNREGDRIVLFEG